MVIIKEKTFSIIAKPNSKRNEILGYDSARKAYKVAIAAPAQDGRANIELVKFLSKEMKRRVMIKSGFTGKRKIIEVF
jgi:uncharacterized protein (TIGR00251 family)